MHIRLLGPLEIEDGLRRLGPADLGGRKPKQLLEILLTERDRIVPKDRIADLLWPDELPKDASATIDTYVSVLRRHLEPATLHARDSRYVRRGPPGYLFDAAEVEVDVDRFQALIAEGQRAHNHGDLEHTGRAFAAVIDLYRGAYLEDEPQAPWTLGPRERLKRAYIDLLVAAAEVSTARGGFNEGLRFCERAIEHDVICEEAFRWAMLCCYALGRQDEALRTFQRCSKVLAQELGTSPMPETDALHRRMLQGLPVQQLLADALPSIRMLQTERMDLPFLGRQAEMAALEDAWRATENGVLLVMVEGEELLARRLLIERDGELSFPHDLVRQTIYSSISAPRREVLHRQALRALEAQGAPMAELASHALAGGMWASAVRYAMAAGNQALELYANAEAAAHFTRALTVLQAHPGLVEPIQFESLLIQRARALIVLSDIDEALNSLEQARASARSRGDARVEAEVAHWMGLAHWAAWTPSRALPHARRALALAQRLNDQHLIGRAHAFLANPHGSLGHLDEALQHAARALATYKQLNEDPPAMVLYRIGIIRHQRSEEAAALKALQRGEALALAQHEETILVFVRWVRATALANLGRYQEAFAALAAAESSGKGEEAFARSRIPNTYGAFYADLSLWHEALEHDLESLDVMQSISGSRSAFQEPLIHTLLNVAEDHLALGAPERAIQAIERVVQLMPEAEYARFRYQNRLHYVRALLALAREEAEAALEAAACLTDAAAYRAAKYEVRGRLVKGRALARLGNVEAAKTELIAAARLAEQLGYPAWAWRAWTAAAEVAHAPRLAQHAAEAVQRLADNLDTELRERFLRIAAKSRH